MNKIDADGFIKQYSRFYIEESNKNIPEKEFGDAGVPKNLNTTKQKLEEYITKKIKYGEFDAESFAWKAGKAGWKAGKTELKEENFVYIDPLPGKWINGSGGEIKLIKDNQEITFTKDSFNDYVSKHRIDMDKYNLMTQEGRKSLFLDIRNKYCLRNYGTVYIINHMFFLSKGKVPIYDRFAHVAVKSLFMNKSPLEVYVPEAPSKDAHPKGRGPEKNNYYLALNILEEYMWLLKEVFPDEIHKNGDDMYISRKLDQALWVYGHAIK